jgi:RNA-directed DNA polymerase
MLANIPTDRRMLQKWLKAGFIDKGQLFPTTAGTPQGGSISPTLMNMTLDGLEEMLAAHFGRNDNPAIRRNKVHAIRYADDMVVTGASKELLEQKVKPLIEHFLAQRGLTLSPAKTRIVHIEEGFDFLGWNIRKYRGTLLIKPAKANVKAFLATIRDTVKANKTARQVNLIGLLNPIIRGWAQYHRGAVAKDTFSWVDSEIWRCLWKWAKRRHPHKSRYWIVRKYFHRFGTRNWVFAAQTERCHPDGNPVWIRLWRASDVQLKRHAKVRGDANPFDPEWENYFENRLRLKMQQHLQGRKTLLSLWKRQDGVCPNCTQKLTEESGWHLHHRLPRSAGGKDNISNLMLVHPNCHRQIHAKG